MTPQARRTIAALFLSLALLTACVGPETFVVDGTLTVTDGDGNDLSTGGKVFEGTTLIFGVNVNRTTPSDTEGGSPTVEPAAGEEITFTIDDSTGGFAGPRHAVTDANGHAQVTVVTGERDGRVEVKVRAEHSDNASSYAPIESFAESQYLTIDFAADETSTMAVATLLNMVGTPAIGEEVRFRILESEIDSGSIVGVATTDSSGIASAVILSPPPGTMVIEAKADRARPVQGSITF